MWRTILFFIAPTLGSMAFQMSVDAGYIRHFTWAVPWVWALCLAIWTLIFLTHDKFKNQWARSFHECVGGWIYLIRVGLCLVVFLLVGGVIHTLTARVVHPTATLQPAPINNSESQTNSDQGTAQKEPPPQRKGKVKSADNKRASQDQKAQIPEGTNPPVVLNNSPGSVLSFGQSGGITAGTVNIGPPEPKLTVSVISETPIQSPDNSSVVSEFRKRLAITTDRDTDKLSFTLIFDAPFTKAEVSTSFFNQIAVQEESLTTIAGEPAYMFSLKSPSMLRVNDAIYVDVYSRQPIKPVRFEKGLL